MKKLILITFSILVSSKVFSQSDLVVRHMHSKLLGKDSVIIYFNQHYNLVEPNCAMIIRHGHYNTLKRHYFGPFKDICSNDTSFVISQGNYSKNGLKQGQFIIYYLNKSLQAKGSFENDKFEGEWFFYYTNGHLKEKANFKKGNYQGRREVYYEDGSPKIFMLINGDKCKVIDAWEYGGKKVIDHGNGFCTLSDISLPWQGRFLNGLPDSVWSFKISDGVFGNESFNKGKFLGGYNHNSVRETKYDDNSKINLLPSPPRLSFLHSEFLTPTDNTCADMDYQNLGIYRVDIFN